MKSIAILCDDVDRELEKLQNALTASGIKSERFNLINEQTRMNLTGGLKVTHSSPIEIVTCAQVYAEKHRRVLKATKPDSTNEIAVTQDNILDLLADGYLLFFEIRE